MKNIPLLPVAGCVRVTVTIPRSLKGRMKGIKHVRVNWSRVAAMAFEDACGRLEKKR